MVGQIGAAAANRPLPTDSIRRVPPPPMDIPVT